MRKQDAISQRFADLEKQLKEMRYFPVSNSRATRPDYVQFQQWTTSAMNLLDGVFGKESPHVLNFAKLYAADSSNPYRSQVERLSGVFLAAKSDFEGGYVFALKTQLSGEIFGDFVVLAKRCLADGHKDVAAVLVCAALEDALIEYYLTL